MDFSPSGVAAPPGALYCSHNKHWCAREKFMVKNEATGEVVKTCDDCRMKVAGFYTVGKPPKKKRCAECTLANVDCTHCLCTSCSFCKSASTIELSICGHAREGGQSGDSAALLPPREKLGEKCVVAPPLQPAARRANVTMSAPACAMAAASISALLSSIFAPGAGHHVGSAEQPPSTPSSLATRPPGTRPRGRGRRGRGARGRAARRAVSNIGRVFRPPGPRVPEPHGRPGESAEAAGAPDVAQRPRGVHTMSATSGSSNDEGINALCDLVARTFSSDDSSARASRVRAVSSQLKVKPRARQEVSPPQCHQPDLDHVFGDLGHAGALPEGALFTDDDLSQSSRSMNSQNRETPMNSTVAPMAAPRSPKPTPPTSSPTCWTGRYPTRRCDGDEVGARARRVPNARVGGD